MDINLQQAFDLFIFDRETYCNAKTVKNYKNTLSYFFDYMKETYHCEICDIKLSDVTLMDLKGYVIMLRKRDKLSSHPYKPTEHKPITNTSIRTYSIDLRTFFNFLYDNDYMENNLMKKFKLIKRETKLVLPLFADEVKEIDTLFNLKTCSGLRNYCMVHLMLDEGLRSGDVCNLRIHNINFQQNHILIFDGKGNKDRIVPLASGLKKHLHQYATIYRPYTEHDYMFCSADGSHSPVTENTIKCLFARIRKKTEITRLKPHLLRHIFATSFILGGGDLESLRIYLGHTSYDTTQNYLHLANTYNRMGSDVYRLDKIFFKTYYSVS
ncbi:MULTISPECIES: tyrosine-type recombinase/integrase [Blautia]|uniref:tyrosine-type recombinase/integrase n=1 Tax=Blautia TaxID=572511 RepID=UPI000BA46EBE|nr:MULTISPECIES: tyrosine-type recombinase/integrase [Blautia]